MPRRKSGMPVPSGCTPQISRIDFAQHDGEPEGEQQIGAAVAAAVEVAQQDPLEHHADEPDHDRRDDERQTGSFR